MGRLLLLIALVGLAPAACSDTPAGAGAPGADPGGSGNATAPAVDDPPAASRTDAGAALRGSAPTDGMVPAHAGLACVACHRGEMADRDVGSVPAATCASGGCHTDAGPAEVSLATVTFEHREHGQGEPIAMECAGCHYHDSGEEPLSAGTSACALCHADQLEGGNPTDCRRCHEVPDHIGVTSQGVEIRHEGMAWVQGECVRCHYDVNEPLMAVSASTCAACHEDVRTITERSIGEDLHPDHTGVSCASCHGDGGHRIVAMSSAVSLDCSQCHLRSHSVDVTPDFPGSETCAACHGDAHAAQQRLVLGAVPDRPDATPSEKYLDGLTCRSCHVLDGPASAPAAGGDVVLATGVSCVGCHRPEYRTVLDWWTTGTDQRVRIVEGYLDGVESRIGSAPPEAASALMADARRLLGLVRDGGGGHNLPLAHRLLETSLERAGDAVRSTGGSPASPPELGRQPRMGVCSYCHYRTDDRMRFGEMDVEFHRDALGVETSRRAGGG